MTAEEFRATIQHLGMSRADAARFLSVSGVDRWWHGQSPVPGPAAKLLLMMVALEIPPQTADAALLRLARGWKPKPVPRPKPKVEVYPPREHQRAWHERRLIKLGLIPKPEDSA